MASDNVVSMIPNSIHKFVKATVDGSHKLADNPLVERQSNVLSIVQSLVSGGTAKGSGVITKREIKGVSTKDSGKDKTLIRFGVSDGENSVPCVVHNCNEKYGLGTGLNADVLTVFDEIIRKSLSEGKSVKVEGLFANFRQERVFVVETIKWAEDVHQSQLSDAQVNEFLKICKKEKVAPLDVLMDNDGLWAEIYADDDLKQAILLYCLSPFDKEDMIHIGLITNPGEGKNHLVDKVISPLVRCRMVGTGKLSTFAAMFGAMSSDDLTSIEIGLLPKMNHDRIVFSEFQTLDEDVFGEMLNVMTDGHYNLQKGKLDVTRHAMLNMAFFGNPPAYYDPEKGHSKGEMMRAFGEYTMQIVSRLTLIFAKPTLCDDEDAPMKIRTKIMQNMDKTVNKGTSMNKINNLRAFFREYLKYVSRLHPKLDKYMDTLNAEMIRMESTEGFKEAFAGRGKTDYRKWAELLNIVRGFARLNGRAELAVKDVTQGMNLFCKSLKTLCENFDLKAMELGMNGEHIELHSSLIRLFGDGSGVATGTIKDMNAEAKRQGRWNEWVELQAIILDSSTNPPLKVVDILSGGMAHVKPWDGEKL
jgi:hypothetical protein